MIHTIFNGQQSDERILHTIQPHTLTHTLSLIKWIFFAVFIFLMTFSLGTVLPDFGIWIRVTGVLVGLVIISTGLWWTKMASQKTRTYITDRRIIRFETTTPFYETKRALFWNEALKTKAITPNFMYRMLNIGIVKVEPLLGTEENIIVTDVHYFNDIANYIDKILYMVKNKPGDLDTIRPFVPKPKGQRD